VAYSRKNIYDKDELSVVLPGIAMILNRRKIDEEYSSKLAVECINLLRESGRLCCIDKLLTITDPGSKLTSYVQRLVKEVSDAGMLLFFPEFYIETQYSIGEYFRSVRIIKGFTRNKIAEQVCDASTILRIENNLQTPQDYIRSKVEQKLELSIKRNTYPFLTSCEYELLEIGKSIKNDLELGQYKKMLEKIKLLESRINLNSPLNKQFIDLYKVVALHSLNKIGTKTALCILNRVLKMTLPEEIDVSIYTLSENEVLAICYIGEIYYKIGKKKDGIVLVKKMYDRKSFSVRNKATVAFSLISLYWESGIYVEIVKICKDGIGYALSCNDAILFCKFDYLLQKSLEQMGKSNLVEESMDVLQFWNVESIAENLFVNKLETSPC